MLSSVYGTVQANNDVNSGEGVFKPGAISISTAQWWIRYNSSGWAYFLRVSFNVPNFTLLVELV